MATSPNRIRIQDSLDAALARKRVVLWYDPSGEWGDDFESYQPEATEKRRVEKRRVVGNEFATKVAISRASLDHRFLLYIPSEKPPEPDNWLLDLLLAGHEFKADRASLDIQDAGLTLEFKPLAQQHKAFFRSTVRTTKLRELLRPNDDEAAVRLKMLAVLAKQPPDIDKLLLHAFSQLVDPTDTEADDPVEAAYGSAQLSEHFWKVVASKFGYRSPAPKLRDFAVALFRSVSPISPQGEVLRHGRVFLSTWKDSRSKRQSFVDWSNAMADLLAIETQLNDAPPEFDPGEADSFEVIDRFVLHRLVQGFAAGDADAQLLQRIRNRRPSTWYEKHQHGYQAIEQAISLRSLLQKTELQVESFEAGLQHYINSWWRIDGAYRRCTFHAHAYQQPGLLEKLCHWVESHYVNNFLLPLTNLWSDQVSGLSEWRSVALPRQKGFHMRYVHPPLGSRSLKRLFVVISDALRYEAARDFADRLQNQPGKGWQVEVEALLGSLPSYTQLGMASLLPNAQVSLNPANGTATVDGVSATGIENRDKILKAYANGRAKALLAENFLNLPTKTAGRELTDDHDLIVIYHNHIDQVGDKQATEVQTCQAVEQAFEELEKILGKINSLKGSQALITADHGFLFQQKSLDANDKAVFPPADQLPTKSRRFALGDGIEPRPGQKIFAAQALGFTGSWSAVFPLGLDRFPKSGSGARFVHGGTSLQEVVVPVIKLKREAKEARSQPVEVELLRIPTRITTSRLKVSLFQRDPVEAKKVQPLQLRIGLYAKADGATLCATRTLLFDSVASDPRERERQITLELSNAADDYNNQLVELRLEQLVKAVAEPVPYKKVELKLQRPFGRDFDDF